MRKSLHKITFAASTDARAVVLAKLGLGNKAIQGRTGLSDGQISYRLGKHKRIWREEIGYRQSWRLGESVLVNDIIQDLAAVMTEDVQRHTPPKIAHPTPKTVKVPR
jgi:hypothetical protein